jgi:hypothetical protein
MVENQTKLLNMGQLSAISYQEYEGGQGVKSSFDEPLNAWGQLSF